MQKSQYAKRNLLAFVLKFIEVEWKIMQQNLKNILLQIQN